MYESKGSTFTALALAVVLTTAVASAQPYAYVANVSGNNLSVVNTASGTVTATIAVPAGPSGLAFSPDGSTLYVTSQTANSVSVISTSTNSVLWSVNVGATPVRVAVHPNGAVAYVVNQGGNSVSVVSLASKAVIATIPVGAHPSGIAISPDGSTAYVGNVYGGTVSVIHTADNTVAGAFAANTGPTAIAVSATGTVAYVANEYSNTVTVHAVPAGNLIATISGFSFPNALALTPNGTSLYVVNGNASTASVVSTASNSIVATIPTCASGLPSAVAISADGTEAYVANEDGFSLSVIDTSTNAVTSTVARVGVYPVAVATAPPPIAPVCTYSISPGSASFASSGGTGSVTVTAPSGCSWTAGSNVSWASITSGSSGNGSGSVSYQVNADTGTSGQNGTLTIAGQTFAVSVAGITCSYSLSSSSVSMGAAGGSGSVTVIAPPACAWTALSNAGWISITSGNSGSGSATVSFQAGANNSLNPQSGTLTIAGQTFTVSEGGEAFSTIYQRCGGPAYTDPHGNVWVADVSNTNRSNTMTSIANTSTVPLYQSERWSTGTLQYQYTVPNGSYEVTLKFAEFYLTQKGQRQMNIVINGTTVLSSFDILANTNPNSAYDITFPVVVSGGQITVQLVPVVGPVKLSSLEIAQ